jgi:hypothetical protein
VSDVSRTLLWRQALSHERCKLTPTQRLVAHVVANHADREGKGARAGADRIAGETGLVVRTVRTSLAVLVDSGWLKLVTRGGQVGQMRVANTYHLVIPRYALSSNAPVQPTTVRGSPDAPCIDPFANPVTSSAALTSAPPEAVDDQLSKVREALNDAAPVAAQIRRPA